MHDLSSRHRVDVPDWGLTTTAGDSSHQSDGGHFVNESETEEIIGMLLQSQSPGSIASVTPQLTGTQDGSSDTLTQPAVVKSSPERISFRTSTSSGASIDTTDAASAKQTESRSGALKRKNSQVLCKDIQVSKCSTAIAIRKKKVERNGGMTDDGSSKPGSTFVDDLTNQAPASTSHTSKVPGPLTIVTEQGRGIATCAPRLVLPGPLARRFDPPRDLDFSVPSAPRQFTLPNSVGLTARRLSQLQSRLHASSSRSSSTSSSCHSCPILSLSPGSAFSDRSALSFPSPPSSPMPVTPDESSTEEYPTHLEVDDWVAAIRETAHMLRRDMEGASLTLSGPVQLSTKDMSSFLQGVPVQNLCFGKKKAQVDRQVKVRYPSVLAVAATHTRILAGL